MFKKTFSISLLLISLSCFSKQNIKTNTIQKKIEQSTKHKEIKPVREASQSTSSDNPIEIENLEVLPPASSPDNSYKDILYQKIETAESILRYILYIPTSSSDIKAKAAKMIDGKTVITIDTFVRFLAKELSSNTNILEKSILEILYSLSPEHLYNLLSKDMLTNDCLMPTMPNEKCTLLLKICQSIPEPISCILQETGAVRFIKIIKANLAILYLTHIYTDGVEYNFAYLKGAKIQAIASDIRNFLVLYKPVIDCILSDSDSLAEIQTKRKAVANADLTTAYNKIYSFIDDCANGKYGYGTFVFSLEKISNSLLVILGLDNGPQMGTLEKARFLVKTKTLF